MKLSLKAGDCFRGKGSVQGDSPLLWIEFVGTAELTEVEGYKGDLVIDLERRRTS